VSHFDLSTMMTVVASLCDVRSLHLTIVPPPFPLRYRLPCSDIPLLASVATVASAVSINTQKYSQVPNHPYLLGRQQQQAYSSSSSSLVCHEEIPGPSSSRHYSSLSESHCLSPRHGSTRRVDQAAASIFIRCGSIGRIPQQRLSWWWWFQ
jgi:hypothetical protein